MSALSTASVDLKGHTCAYSGTSAHRTATWASAPPSGSLGGWVSSKACRWARGLGQDAPRRSLGESHTIPRMPLLRLLWSSDESGVSLTTITHTNDWWDSFAWSGTQGWRECQTLCASERSTSLLFAHLEGAMVKAVSMESLGKKMTLSHRGNSVFRHRVLCYRIWTVYTELNHLLFWLCWDFCCCFDYCGFCFVLVFGKPGFPNSF